MTGNDQFIDSGELESMVKKIISESDTDKDGKLSYSEFKQTLVNINIDKDFTIGPWKEE